MFVMLLLIYYLLIAVWTIYDGIVIVTVIVINVK